MEITHKDVADAIMQRQETILIGKRYFNLYPITLGKSLLIGKLYDTMGLDRKGLIKDPNMECLRLVVNNIDMVCRIIAYVASATKYDVFNVRKIADKINYLKNNANTEELATLLMYVLNATTAQSLQDILGVTKEKQRIQKILKCKEHSNTSITVGGVSIYGSLLDVACERYGWTLDYVVWGISMANLETILADKIDSIHLTDKEAKRCKVSRDSVVVNADDPKNKNFLKRLFQD